MKNEIIVIENKPGLLTVNFDEIKKHLTKELAKYDVLVTADTLKGAKKLATELNATKRHIDTVLKDAISKASEPIKKVDLERKELVAMCEAGRQKLLSQAKTFEDETREKVHLLLKMEREKLWNSAGVSDEFKNAEFDDLVLLSHITGTGKLTAGAISKLRERANADKAKQDQTERRLLQLENQSYKAGLSAPLTRDHVNTFLFAEEDVYQSELDRIIASEIQRQEQAEQAMRARIEKENKQAELAASTKEAQEQAQESVPDSHPVQEPTTQESAPETAQEPESAPAAQKSVPTARFVVTCTFELEIDARASESMVESQLRGKLADAGFTTLSSVHATRQSEAA